MAQVAACSESAQHHSVHTLRSVLEHGKIVAARQCNSNLIECYKYYTARYDMITARSLIERKQYRLSDISVSYAGARTMHTRLRSESAH